MSRNEKNEIEAMHDHALMNPRMRWINVCWMVVAMSLAGT
jgi:hypothetical protein